MNSHVRIDSIQGHTPHPGEALRVRRKLPDWFARAMLVVAGVVTVAWASFLLWLPGYLAGIW